MCREEIIVIVLTFLNIEVFVTSTIPKHENPQSEVPR